MQEILTVREISKTFNLSAKQRKIEKALKKTALDKLSFSAYKGEIFGLLGPNGAGKTTALRILSTLIQPDSGDAEIEGISVRKNPDEVRKKIGFLTSELKLDDYFTPNYLFNFFSSLYKVEPSFMQRRKKELFEKFGIDKFAEVRIADLSTGMKQKVSLAIAIVHDPEILIFDEPTNGLDVLTAKIVTDFLAELKKQGKTIVLSTHIFSLIEKVCDRVGIIINGKMTVCDTLGKITENRPLEDVFFDIYRQEVGELE
ncbi:MAG: ABC transporter ATP-binding protein [Oscillospiraceae bacterium]|jgi:sodium transport system ATP-binding protein|nr:ABC transporter ATP-binding protein [Oscillospiraceae bacterium]